MSFRYRFALIAVLVVAMLTMAALALQQLRADREVVREDAMVAAADGLADALARRAHEHHLDAAELEGHRPMRGHPPHDGPHGHPPGPPPEGFPPGPPPDCEACGPPDEHADDGPFDPITNDVDDLLTSVPRSSGGYCTTDGTVLVARSAKTGLPGRLLPADFDLAASTCRQSAPAHARHAMPNDLLLVSTHPVEGTLVAWALTRLPSRRAPANAHKLLVPVVGMSLACLLLVGLSIDGWRALRRGTRELATALVRLRSDLRADIPVPRAAELALIAGELRTMATDLADSRGRERTLERRLDHEQRLAGLGRVVAGVAHEVRNPITGIKLVLDGLARRGLDDRARDDVNICLEEIARLDRVVSSLLLVARTAPTDKETIAIGGLCDERVARCMPSRGITIKRTGDAEIVANREVLVATIDNLLRNAMEASPDHSEIEIVITPKHLEVRDRGPGVPTAREGELFEPFFTTKPTGTGLGLFLSRSLLTAQGATLSYRREGDQTVFDVELP